MKYAALMAVMLLVACEPPYRYFPPDRPTEATCPTFEFTRLGIEESTSAAIADGAGLLLPSRSNPDHWIRVPLDPTAETATVSPYRGLEGYEIYDAVPAPQESPALIGQLLMSGVRGEEGFVAAIDVDTRRVLDMELLGADGYFDLSDGYAVGHGNRGGRIALLANGSGLTHEVILPSVREGSQTPSIANSGTQVYFVAADRVCPGQSECVTHYAYGAQTPSTLPILLGRARVSRVARVGNRILATNVAGRIYELSGRFITGEADTAFADVEGVAICDQSRDIRQITAFAAFDGGYLMANCNHVAVWTEELEHTCPAVAVPEDVRADVTVVQRAHRLADDAYVLQGRGAYRLDIRW